MGGGGAERSPLSVDFGIGQVVNADAAAGVTRLGFTQTILYTGSARGPRHAFRPTGHRPYHAHASPAHDGRKIQNAGFTFPSRSLGGVP